MGTEHPTSRVAQDCLPLTRRPESAPRKIFFAGSQVLPEFPVFYNMKGLFSSTSCILCGAPAERFPHGTGGWAYECSGRCPPYSVPASLHYLLELDLIFPRETKLRIAEYLIGLYLDDGEAYELSKEDLNLVIGDKIQ